MSTKDLTPPKLGALSPRIQIVPREELIARAAGRYAAQGIGHDAIFAAPVQHDKNEEKPVRNLTEFDLDEGQALWIATHENTPLTPGEWHLVTYREVNGHARLVSAKSPQLTVWFFEVCKWRLVEKPSEPPAGNGEEIRPFATPPRDAINAEDLKQAALFLGSRRREVRLQAVEIMAPFVLHTTARSCDLSDCSPSEMLRHTVDRLPVEAAFALIDLAREKGLHDPTPPALKPAGPNKGEAP